MTDWRIRKRYGHGAARIVLSPQPARSAESGGTFVSDVREVGLDMFGGAKSALACCLVIFITFMFTAMRDRVDFSAQQLAMWSTEKVVPEPVAKVVPPAPKPIPVPVKPVVEKKIAKAKPKPPPVKKVKPKPVPVQTAKIEKPKALPKPKPVAKIKPKARKPKIEMAALSKPKIPKAAKLERKRVAVVNSGRRKSVALKTAALNAPLLPSGKSVSPSRAQRVKSQPARRASRAPVLAAAQNSLPTLESASSPSPGRSAPAFARAKNKGRPNLQLAAATSPGLAALPTQSAPSRRSRQTAVAPNTNASRKARADIGMAPAALAPRPPAPIASVPAPNRVTARTDAAKGRSRAAGSEMSLRGVSLGSLASCMSDREEDLLKQRVLAAVRNRGTCESSFGTYRFVETKNLNAFSMWIENAPGREASDRCVELTHALACLE